MYPTDKSTCVFVLRIHSYTKYNEPCSEYQFWLALKITRCKENVVCAPLFIAWSDAPLARVCIHCFHICCVCFPFFPFNFVQTFQCVEHDRIYMSFYGIYWLAFCLEHGPQPNGSASTNANTQNSNVLVCFLFFWLDSKCVFHAYIDTM